MKRLISIILVIAVMLSLYFIKVKFVDKSGETASQNTLKVHFVDVGQGDSCFIELPNHKSMLIDAGESRYGNTISNYISSLGYNTIDFVVATHAHSDHIGGLPEIFDNFDVKSCYASAQKASSRVYKNFKQFVDDEGLKIQIPSAGEYILNESSLKIKVLGPFKKKYRDVNNSSVVILLSYYSNDFLFTGDAGYDVLKQYNPGDIEVLKVSHHGSRTGTSKELINELKPEYSVISVAGKNKYSHPHKEVLELLDDSEVYKTSVSGTVTITCDNDSLKIDTEKLGKAG